MDSVIELQDLKTMLQLETTDQDGLLNLIIKNTTKALRFKLGLNAGKEFPQELDYIVLGVCVRRYNRLKNEGMASYSQEGESITFKSDDFDDFLSESINLRWGAKTDSDLIATLNPGDVVKYDAFSKHDGYVWLRQVRDNGQFGYLASGECDNSGKRISSWSKFE